MITRVDKSKMEATLHDITFQLVKDYASTSTYADFWNSHIVQLEAEFSSWYDRSFKLATRRVEQNLCTDTVHDEVEMMIVELILLYKQWLSRIGLPQPKLSFKEYENDYQRK